MNIPKPATRLPILARGVTWCSDYYSNTYIYSVEDTPGIYRQVSRDGRTGLKKAEGNVLVILETGLREMRRWRELEELLRPLLPGTESPNPEQTDLPM